MATEKRLIDANALMEQMHNHYEVRNPAQNATMDECCMMVFNAPAVDAVAVAHGRWTLLQKNGFAFGVTCSECNTTWDDKSNYCPNCGAKMDGDGDA